VIILIMELLGTVAFAISGALVAVKGRLDLFGVIFVGCITAVGGGILRDVLMGRFPANIFSNTKILLLAVVTCILTFVVSYLRRKSFDSFQRRTEIVNNFFDAIGLAAFSVTGVEKAIGAGYSAYPVFAICMGVLTGIGGGILRDVMVDKTPYVLRKHVYAVASLAGSSLYFFTERYLDKTAAAIASVILIILIRVMATKFHWKLPRIDLEGDKDDNTAV